MCKVGIGSRHSFYYIIIMYYNSIGRFIPGAENLDFRKVLVENAQILPIITELATFF
jgi:hypothetical protein